MIIALILAFLIGVFSVLLLEAFLLYKWWTSKEGDTRKLYPQRTRVTNPEFIADYHKKDSATEKESCMSLNLLLSFLWREWRDSPQMKTFFLNKMNMEFADLMQGRAASKLIEQITIEEFSLGSSLPVIKGATVMKIGARDPKEVPQELDIAVDLEYSGGCHMAILVDLLFNKSVYLAIKMVYLRGRARLQLSRHPLTHWSLAFYEEPEVEFEAESQFEGKNLPQLTSLIINHLRKSIQKKHTLPSYKIRYHPFFRELSPQDETQEVYVHDSLVTVGTLEVKVVGCTRLPELENGVLQYCSLSVDLLPWSQLAENRRAMWPTFEIELNRDSDISFGLTLSKEVSEDDLGKTIVIDTIVVDSPAYTAGVQAKDVLVAVDGQKIESLKQAAKMIKSKSRFTATVQRPPSRMTQPIDQENPDKERVSRTLVNFKNVTLSNESDSEDEFVNIVVPLLETHADSEMDKSTVREILLSRSTELKHKAGKKIKGKQGKRTSSPGPTAAESSSLTKNGVEQTASRDQKSTGLSGKDVKSEISPRPNTDQVSQDAIDKKASPQPANNTLPPVTNQRRVSYASLPALDGLDNKKTTEVRARPDPVWDETVEFKILKKDQFLNVCIWSKSQEKNDKNILLGYVTIPLMEIALQCLSKSSKSHEECYVLVSPHSDRVISSHPHLRSHAGLKERLCCGDITLVFHHTPSLVDCDNSILNKVDSLEQSTQQNENADSLESLEPPKHQFIFTQFYFPTRCSYCSKKVWTKVAFQCRTCAMICHKKCLQSCVAYTHCVHTTPAKSRWFSKKASKTSEDGNLEGENEEIEEEETLEDGQTQAVGTPEITEESSDLSGSLEHNHTTVEKTKLSAETGTTALEENAAWDTTSKVQASKQTTESNGVVSNESGSRGAASDMEMASERVREAGRELFTNLPLEVRKNKLQEMMSKLQVEIDEESETRTDLYEEISKMKDKKRRAFIESLLTKSEERSQALAMLMLQYCAGLQSCADAEELETCQL